MKCMLCHLFWGFLFLGGVIAHAQDPNSPKCQILASKFGENPDSLTVTELERLRFCVSQSLEDRQKTLEEGLLKGTIIDPVFSPETSQDSQTPSPPTGLKGQ